MSNILGYYNNEKINVNETTDENVNMPVVFVRNANNQSQRLLIDTPDELFYNPSTKTLHADNFSGGISSNLIEGEAIKLTNSNGTIIDVNFDKNTATTTAISSGDKILVQDSLDFLKTITGSNLRESLKPTSGLNLSYGSGANVNTLNLDTDLTDVNSIQSETNEDLKLQSSSSSLVIKANATFNTIGKIHLARIDDDSIRFNTIEYSNNSNDSYIKFLVHYTGTGDNLVREVLKLNSNLDSEFSGNVNIATGKTYKMDGSDISGSNLNYSAGVTLNTKIDSKQASLTFGKLENNVPYFQEDVLTNDVIVMGSTNLIGINYSELKGLLSLNLVDNTSDLNKPISTSTQTALDTKQTILFFGKLSGFALKLEETVVTNDVLVMGSSNVKGLTYSELKTQLQIPTYNNGTNITIDGSNNINLNTTLSNMIAIVGISDLSVKAQGEIIYMSGFDGGTVGGKDHVFKTNNGTSIVTLMTLSKDKNITGLNSITAGQGYFTTMNSTNSNMTGNLDVTGTVTSDNSFKLNTHKVLFNVGTDEGTNPYLNARVLQNTSSLYNDGMYINYQSSGSSRCRLYAGSSTSPRMQIDTDGNVGIGTTSPDEKLDINGNLVLGMICIKANKDTAFAVAQGTNPNHGNGTLSMGMGSGNVSNYIYFASRNSVGNLIYGTLYLPTSGSDDRRKHNEKPITSALDSIMKLQCETYDKTFIFKDTDWSGNLDDVEHSKEAGLIAQDVYKIDEFEDYVLVGDENTSWDINYNSIFTYNIRATQELKLENDELKNKVNELEILLKKVCEKINITV